MSIIPARRIFLAPPNSCPNHRQDMSKAPIPSSAATPQPVRA